MIAYRATFDVPTDTVVPVSRWLCADRTTYDRRPWQRAATPYLPAVVMLGWFQQDTEIRILTRDAGVSVATAYRYLHEAIEAIAEHAGLNGDTYNPCSRLQTSPRSPAGNTNHANWENLE